MPVSRPVSGPSEEDRVAADPRPPAVDSLLRHPAGQPLVAPVTGMAGF